MRASVVGLVVAHPCCLSFRVPASGLATESEEISDCEDEQEDGRVEPRYRFSLPLRFVAACPCLVFSFVWFCRFGRKPAMAQTAHTSCGFATAQTTTPTRPDWKDAKRETSAKVDGTDGMSS